MAQPVWITPSGNLGKIPEGVFFQMPLLAENPASLDPLYYEIIAGELPPGMQCDDTGLLVGIPKAVISLQGVPLEVSRDVTSKFAARVYTKKVVNGIEVVDRLADRTFTITVTGQNVPEFITPPGTLATYFDGTQVLDLQIQYTDTDPDDIVVVKLISGSLPPGLTISPTGLISGYIAPINNNVSLEVPTTNYEFLLEITDGKSSNVRSFNIRVYSRSDLVADTAYLTADDTFVTADETPAITPIMLTPAGSIGSTRSDNFFAFQFIGLDPDSGAVSYELQASPSLPGLTLDPNTGWLYGYIPDLGLAENTYSFVVRAHRADNYLIVSADYQYSLTIIGSIDAGVTWISPSNLGSIDNGSVSVFNILAVNRAGIPLQYRLLSGSDSSLPQGLQLLPSGNIAGRVSFDTFTLDSGTTVFDVDSRDASITQPTTFDLTFIFVVEAYGQGYTQVSVTKTFSITVVRAYNQPYENLYIQAMPPQDDRSLVQSLLQNQDIIPVKDLYRPDDTNFGLAQRVVYWHAYGLTSSTYDEYISALYENHYWKNLVLGEIKTAQALDDLGNVLYEVVYSQVVDNLVNASGESVDKSVVLPYPVNPGTPAEVDIVHPNSLSNMRDQVIDTVGKISDILPRWMLSKQTNGQVLGFVPCWVIAYIKPGKSGQIAYNIKTQFGTDRLNQVDFEVDRYELDQALSRNWDSVTNKWVPSPPLYTRFDQSYEPVGWINDSQNSVSWKNNNNSIVIWNNDVGNPQGTIFDGNSLQFIDPVDMYITDNSYDKYLVFPKRNILE